ASQPAPGRWSTTRMNGRLLRSVPVACLLLGLLVLVALAARAGREHTSLPSVPGPPAAALDYGLTIMLAVFAAVVLVALTRLRLPKPRHVRSSWHTVWSIVFLAGSLAAGIFIARHLHVLHHGGGGGSGGSGQHLTEPKSATDDRP